jgi:hypothetical protein
MGIFSSSSASMAPIWAQPREEPLPSTRPTVFLDGMNIPVMLEY